MDLTQAESWKRRPTSQDAGSAKGKRTKAAKATKSKGTKRLKHSLLLAAENDLQLTVLASFRGTDRSTLLNSILDDALRGLVVSLRGAAFGRDRRGRGGGC